MQKPQQIPTAATCVSLRAATAPQRPGGDSAAALPTRFPLLRWGINDSTKGPVIVNEKTVAVLTQNQTLIKRPEIKGDFEHESSKPEVRHPINYAVSSAIPKAIQGEGLIVEGVKWTALGAEHVPNDYSDLSATVYLDANRVVIGIHSFAVTAHGEVDGITVPLSPPDAILADLTLLSAPGEAIPPQPKPTPKHTMQPSALLVKLLAFLGVQCAPDASPEAMAAAVDEAMTKEKKEPGEAMPVALSATLTALSANQKVLTEKLEALTAGQAKSGIEVLVNAATAIGKLVQLSADDLVKLGPERAKAYLDGLKPGVVPIDQRTPTSLSAGPSLAPGEDPDYMQALRDCGVDPASLKA